MNTVFTETTDGVNASINQLEVTCITSKQNKFHLDSEGNLSVNSITTVVNNPNSNINVDTIYPVGSIYSSTVSTDPSTLFGGTWEQQRTLFGGELIGYGTVNATDGSYLPKSQLISFSDTKTGTKTYDVTNYVDGVLEGTAGTILIHTKGVVGLVEAQMVISGRGESGIVGFWFVNNANPLPNGVTESPSMNKPLLTGPISNSFGGTSNTYLYKVNTTEDVEFYVNPRFEAYGGDFNVSAGGVTSMLIVKVYAQKGKTFTWKRVA